MGKEFEEIMNGLKEMDEFLDGKKEPNVRITTKGIRVSSLHKFTPKKIKSLRISLGLSQAQFADVLGVQKLTVSKWEQGLNPPSGSSLRLLQMLEKHPKILEETDTIMVG